MTERERFYSTERRHGAAKGEIHRGLSLTSFWYDDDFSLRSTSPSLTSADEIILFMLRRKGIFDFLFLFFFFSFYSRGEIRRVYFASNASEHRDGIYQSVAKHESRLFGANVPA